MTDLNQSQGEMRFYWLSKVNSDCAGLIRIQSTDALHNYRASTGATASQSVHSHPRAARSHQRDFSLGTQLKERLQANIPFVFLPLQDSVDLSILLIRTTIAVQNWVVGARGVGGPIDIATITRTAGFRPVQQKSITGERLEWQAPLSRMEEKK